MSKTIQNSGKVLYGTLGIGILVFTFYRYEAKSDLGDFVFMEMWLLMGVLSFPSSILTVPLAFGVSFAVVAAISLVARQFIETSVSYSPLMNVSVFIIWMVLFLGGYLQWFWLPKWYQTKRLKGTTASLQP